MRFRGATRQRQAHKKPDAEIHLVKRLVDYRRSMGDKLVAVEVNRGQRISDCLTVDEDGNVHVFECKTRGQRYEAIRQLENQSAHFKWIVTPTCKSRQVTLDKISQHGIGLIMFGANTRYEVPLNAQHQKMTKQAKLAAIDAIKRNEVKDD